MRGHVCVSALLSAQRRDVERFETLALNLVVRNESAVAGNEFGRGIGKCGAGAQRYVVFDDSNLALVVRDDQIPRMIHRRSTVADRDELKINRRLDNRPAPDVYVGTVFEKSGIECAECIAFNIQIVTQIWLNGLGSLRDLPCETANH